MENENKVYGNLFNSIDLISEDHLEVILETMDKSHALVYMIESVKAAYERNAFTIGKQLEFYLEKNLESKIKKSIHLFNLFNHSSVIINLNNYTGSIYRVNLLTQ
jgi:hypothetical protein